MFEGEGFVDDPVNVAIDDVSVTTENCVLLPYYAKPGDLSFRSLFSFLYFRIRNLTVILIFQNPYHLRLRRTLGLPTAHGH